jgi:hypothetical protein
MAGRGDRGHIMKEIKSEEKLNRTLPCYIKPKNTKLPLAGDKVDVAIMQG